MQLPLASSKQTFKHLVRLAKNHRLLLVLTLILQSLATISGLLVPAFIGWIINSIPQGKAAIVPLVIYAIISGVCALILNSLASLAARTLGQHVFAQMREELVDTIAHLPLSVVEAAGSGDLLSRTVNDVNHVAWLVQRGFSEFANIIFQIGWTIVATLAVNSLLALPIAAVVPLSLISFRWYLARAVPAYYASTANESEVNAALSESCAHGLTIDAVGLHESRRWKVTDFIRRTAQIEAYTAALRTAALPWVSFSVVLPIPLAILWGTYLHSYGLATFGALTTVTLYLIRLMMPVGELTFYYDQLQLSLVSFQRIFGAGNVKPDRQPSGEENSGNQLELRGVYYAYKPGNDVLKDINLTIKPGEHLAVVGASGCGKSTLARLISGFHPPRSGNVTVGGVEVTKLPEKELHKQIVLVTQEAHIFVGTLEYNLRLGNPQASLEDIWQALEATGAKNWVRDLPDALNTLVGEGNLALTEAQQQQISLSRIILMNPHTVILDEATSLLDPQGARRLEKALNAVLAGRTVISIAHHLWSATDADRILVMDHGQIIELGSHQELLELGGVYAGLWNRWQEN